MRHAALALALCASGCMTSTYQTGRPASSVVRTEQAEFYLWGLVGEKTVDLRALCPEGVASFKDLFSPTDAVLQLVTCGIYCPLTIEVHCAGGPAYQVTPQPGQHVATVVRLPEGRP